MFEVLPPFLKKVFNLIRTIFCFLLFVFNNAIAQTKAKVPKNFVGGFFTLNLSNTSITLGGEYEYQFFRKNNLTLGIRGSIFKKYLSENFTLVRRTETPDHFAISMYQIAGTSYWHLPPKEKFKGFFIYGSLGLIYSHATRKIPLGPGNKDKYTDLLPGCELGFGSQVKWIPKTKFRWIVGGSLSKKQNGPYNTEDFLEFIFAKISIGF
jgi:hypothetical protein